MAITVTAQIDYILARYKDMGSRTSVLALLQEFFDEETLEYRWANQAYDSALVEDTRLVSVNSSIRKIWEVDLQYSAVDGKPLTQVSVRVRESEGYSPRSVDSGTPREVYAENSASGARQLGLYPPPDFSTVVISGATNASPIVITTTAAHGLSDGDPVYIQDVAGNTAANGTYYAKRTGYSTVTFALYSDSDLTTAVVGNGAYTSGGLIATQSAPFLRVWASPAITLGEASNTTSLPESILSRDYLASGVWIKHARGRHKGDLPEHTALLARCRATQRNQTTGFLADVRPRVQPWVTRTARSRIPAGRLSIDDARRS